LFVQPEFMMNIREPNDNGQKTGDGAGMLNSSHYNPVTAFLLIPFREIKV
jgi:hypothetical protein